MEAEKKPFDLAALAAADEADLEIVYLDGQKIDWTWTFAGPGHPATIAIDNESNARSIAIEKAKERAQVNGKKWKGDDDTADDIRQRNIRYMVSRLLRWSETTMGEKPFPFSAEAARSLLADRRYFWIYDQVNTFLMEEKSFTARSPKT